MRYFLLPITSILWYYITLCSLMGIILITPIIAGLDMIWFILVGGIFLGIISIIPRISIWFSIMILRFYKFNWISTILHSFFGILATFLLMSKTYMNPNSAAVELLGLLWTESILKSLILYSYIFTTGILIIFFMTIFPIISTIFKYKYQD